MFTDELIGKTPCWKTQFLFVASTLVTPVTIHWFWLSVINWLRHSESLVTSPQAHSCPRARRRTLGWALPHQRLGSGILFGSSSLHTLSVGLSWSPGSAQKGEIFKLITVTFFQPQMQKLSGFSARLGGHHFYPESQIPRLLLGNHPPLAVLIRRAVGKPCLPTSDRPREAIWALLFLFWPHRAGRRHPSCKKFPPTCNCYLFSSTINQTDGFILSSQVLFSGL